MYQNDTLVVSKMFLKQYRTRLGLTQEAVAEEVKISRAGYTMIETGRRRPSPDVAKRIATVLGFPDDWYRLLERDHTAKAQASV